jgi:hypothetical protein
MGKDKRGKYHPPKGKPSGAGKAQEMGMQHTDPEKMDEYLELDKELTEADSIGRDIPVRHHNRNTQKRSLQFSNQADRQNKTNTKIEKLKETKQQPAPIAEELPGILNRESFRSIATYRAPVCVSIYMNSHNFGEEENKQVDPALLKSALKKMEMQLNESGTEQKEINSLLAPAYTIFDDPEFHKNHSAALGIFISDAYLKYIRIQSPVKEEAIIESSFYVSPLIPLITPPEYFYILVISKKQVKLFKADYFAIHFVPVGGLPAGIGDATSDDKTDVMISDVTDRGGTENQQYHGFGGRNQDDDKILITNFFEASDDVIWKQILHNENVPLLLAGVEYLMPIYKSVCDYNNISQDYLKGNYEYVQMDTLYKEAMEIMTPYFEKNFKAAVENYGVLSGQNLTSADPAVIVPAAYYSQISQLFVAKDEHLWGLFDEKNNKLIIRQKKEPVSEDLADNAVTHTIINGGEVFIIDREQMPADSPMAASLRYGIT